jgi:predicted anti-sigma-YlaC factor YlaD
VDRDCGAIQELLVEVAGDVARLDETSARHLRGCQECRQVAKAEASLHRLVEGALPPADLALVARIVAASEASRRRRRLLAFAPVAVSVGLGAAGALLVGGVPGLSLVGALPGWSSQGWVSLLTTSGDWATVVSAVARNAPAVVSTTAVLGAGLVAFGGGVAALASARRGGAVASWTRRG